MTSKIGNQLIDEYAEALDGYHDAMMFGKDDDEVYHARDCVEAARDNLISYIEGLEYTAAEKEKK